jgi:ubiquinone biosynthesis protein UbiJ
MLGDPVIGALNHLLAQSGWALPRLAAFSGQSVRVNLPLFSLVCTVREDGSLRSAAPDTVADASCTVSPTLLPRLALNEPAAWEDVTHTGNEALVKEILFLARNLRWDAAEDLSRFTGDIAAERIVRAASSVHRHARDSALNLFQALAEYWTEERPLIAKPADLGEFSKQVDALDHGLDALEQRVRRLAGPRAGGGTGE